MSTMNRQPVQHDATPCNNQKNDEDALGDYLCPSRELTNAQVRAIDLMLHGLSDAQVAQELNVDRSTVFRWRKDENFARQLDAHRQALLQHSTARLQTLLDPALDIIQKQLAGDDPKTQLRAAALLLRMATPARLARASATEVLLADRKREHEEYESRLMAYINAPLPTPPLSPYTDEDFDQG